MEKIFPLIFIFFFLLFPFQGSAAVPPCPDKLNCAPDSTCPDPSCCNPPDAECRGGFVPCGRNCDNPDTDECECSPCQLCHFFVMFNNIISFVIFKLAPSLAVLMLVVGGIMFFSGGFSPETLTQAKSIIFSVFIGLVIIFSSWIIINTFLNFLGLVETPSSLKWYEIDCPIEPPPPPMPCF